MTLRRSAHHLAHVLVAAPLLSACAGLHVTMQGAAVRALAAAASFINDRAYPALALDNGPTRDKNGTALAVDNFDKGNQHLGERSGRLRPDPMTQASMAARDEARQ